MTTRQKYIVVVTMIVLTFGLGAFGNTCDEVYNARMKANGNAEGIAFDTLCLGQHSNEEFCIYHNSEEVFLHSAGQSFDKDSDDIKQSYPSAGDEDLFDKKGNLVLVHESVSRQATLLGTVQHVDSKLQYKIKKDSAKVYTLTPQYWLTLIADKPWWYSTWLSETFTCKPYPSTILH